MPVNGNLYVNGTISWNRFALYDSCGGSEIQCGDSNQLFTGLSAGTNYKLRVFRSRSRADDGYLSFTIQAYEEVANDDCANAENIVVTTSESTVNFNIGGATINNEEGCTGTTSDFVDIWYDFTMPVNGNLYVNGTISWNRFALYDSCSGTEIQCGDSNQLFTGLSAGTNYKLRLFRYSSRADDGYLSFTIQAYEEVANDDCANAENIVVTTDQSTIHFNIGGATINNEEGCTGTNSDFVDIWYDFTMPVNGNLYVNGTISWNHFALYDSCSGTEIQCGDSNQLFTELSAGTNYKLRLFRYSSRADDGYLSFTIQAYEEVANDDCANAENIVVTTDQSTIHFNIGGATINNEEGCTGTNSDFVDIWYDFTMPVNGNLYVNGTISWNHFALYDSCSGTEIQCGDSNQLFTELSAGTNYKLRLFRYSSRADDGYLSFTIQAYEEAPNDDCANAENIVVTTDQSTIHFNIGGATINNEAGCSGTTSEYADIWYDFTMPVNGNLYVNGTISWNRFALYDSCGGSEIQCGDSNQIFTGLSAGTNYKLRVFRSRSRADDGYLSFTIQAYEEVANDDCANAENIVVTTSESTVNFNIGGATINNEEGCTGTTSNFVDIWYDFTMPVNGNLYVNGTISWNHFALYDSCSGTEIQCGDSNQLFTELSAGTNYKLRLFRYSSRADDGYLSFTIQAYEEAPNDDCANAENIVVTTDQSTIHFNIGGATINNEAGCSGTTSE